MTLGTRIRNARIDVHMTQQQVAVLIPMNQSNYSKIERDQQEPNMTQLIRITQILKISSDRLLGIDMNDYEKDRLDHFQQELDNLFSKYFGTN